MLVENLNRDALGQFAAAADSLSAAGAQHRGGLREAFGVARSGRSPGRPAVRVVLLTDGLLDLEAATAQKMQEQVAQAAAQDIPLDVIDLGQQKEADPQVASLARAGRGTVHRAISTQQIRWALREIVTGRSQLVAAARLQVTFTPSRCWSIAWWATSRANGAGSCRARWRPISAKGKRPGLVRGPAGPQRPPRSGLRGPRLVHRRGREDLRRQDREKAHARIDREQVAASLNSAAPRCKRRPWWPTWSRSCGTRPSFSSATPSRAWRALGPGRRAHRPGRRPRAATARLRGVRGLDPPGGEGPSGQRTPKE